MEDRKAYANVVTIFPPEKHAADDTVLLKLQTKDGIVTLALSALTAKHLAAQMLLITGQGKS